MYRFKEKHADAVIVIPGIREEITASNLTEAKAEMILKKYPQFAHNIEQVIPEEKPKKKAKNDDEELDLLIEEEEKKSKKGKG